MVPSIQCGIALISTNIHHTAAVCIYLHKTIHMFFTLHFTSRKSINNLFFKFKCTGFHRDVTRAKGTRDAASTSAVPYKTMNSPSYICVYSVDIERTTGLCSAVWIQMWTQVMYRLKSGWSHIKVIIRWLMKKIF